MSDLVSETGQPIEADATVEVVEGLDFQILNVGQDTWVEVDKIDGKDEAILCWGSVAYMKPETQVQTPGPSAGLKVPIKREGRISLRELRTKANKLWSDTTDQREQAVAKASIAQAEAQHRLEMAQRAGQKKNGNHRR